MKAQQWSTFMLRFVLGWYMLADGWLIVTNPNWSAAGFLANAKTFPAFYAWFAQPANLAPPILAAARTRRKSSTGSSQVRALGRHAAPAKTSSTK